LIAGFIPRPGGRRLQRGISLDSWRRRTAPGDAGDMYLGVPPGILNASSARLFPELSPLRRLDSSWQLRREGRGNAEYVRVIGRK